MLAAGPEASARRAPTRKSLSQDVRVGSDHPFGRELASYALTTARAQRRMESVVTGEAQKHLSQRIRVSRRSKKRMTLRTDDLPDSGNVRPGH